MKLHFLPYGQILGITVKFWVYGDSALFGQYLALVFAERLAVVGHICRAAHLLKGNLADTHAGV